MTEAERKAKRKYQRREWTRKARLSPEFRERERIYRAKYRAKPESIERRRNQSAALAEYQLAYRKKNRARLRDGVIKRKYGLTLQQREAILVEQDGRCAICRRSERSEKRPLSIDHIHGTTHVRGLLCGPCNMGLGHFYDNPQLLRDAAVYLERNAA